MSGIIFYWSIFILLLPGLDWLHQFELFSESLTPETHEIFASETPLQLKITGDLKSLFSDRSDNPVYYPITISNLSLDSTSQSFKLKAKTRGHSRLHLVGCKYPPILFNFSKRNTPSNSIFFGQDKLKLVVPCKQEQFVIKEYLAYKIYNLITEFSYKVRLVKLEFEDNRSQKSESVIGFLLEDYHKMAARNQAKVYKRKGLSGHSMHKDLYLGMTVFQYMIGNTDWSIEYLHNVRLLVARPHKLPIPVPYDFDHSGLVSAPYAYPAMELQLKTVRDRRYRGYCMNDQSELDAIINKMVALRPAINQMINRIDLLTARSQKQLLDYISEFYKIIENPKRRSVVFKYPCLAHGTGNVIIKGLKQ